MNGVFVHLYLPSEFLQLENITLTDIGQYNKSKPQLVKPFFFLFFFLLFLYIFVFLCVCFFSVCFFFFVFFFNICFVFLFYFVCLLIFFCCCCFVLFNGHFLVRCNCFLQFNLLVVLFLKPSV